MRSPLAGALLVFGAVTFWLAWVLMPDAGTNDAAHILEVVRANRSGVWWSVVVQIVSSVALVPAVLGLYAAAGAGSARGLLLGASLVLVGAMGMCADAFFHLAAYYMTADGVAASTVYEPMRLLQTEGIRLLIPLLLPFFVGGWLFARALRRTGAVSAWPERVFLAAFAGAVVGAVGANLAGGGRHAVVLAFLGAIAVGYAWIGLEHVISPRARPVLS
jgi:hypothetical protein